MTNQRKIGPGFIALAAAIFAAGPAGANEQRCPDGAPYPCGVQLESIGVQPVPALLKFQARVSQARIPVGAGTFERLEVRLLSGTEIVCREKYRDVEVRDGIVNLEIGENLDCDLAETLAVRGDLLLQTCVGDPLACLPGIPLSPSAYAAKSETAGIAQYAGKAHRAGQAHYANRMSPDPQLAETGELTTGYLDFASEPGGDSGAIRWIPTGQRNGTGLHVAALSPGDQLGLLDETVVTANRTVVAGRVEVQVPPGSSGVEARVDAGGATVTGASNVTGSLTTTGGLTVNTQGVNVAKRGGQLNGNLDVAFASTVRAPLQVGNGVTVQSQGLNVQAGGLDVRGRGDIFGNLSSSGSLPMGGPVTVSNLDFTAQTGGLSTAGAIIVNGFYTNTGTLLAFDGMRLGTNGIFIASGGLNVAGALAVAQFANIGGDVNLTSDTFGDVVVSGFMSGGRLVVGGDSNIVGPVLVRGGVVLHDTLRPERQFPAMRLTGNDFVPVLQLGTDSGLDRVRIRPRVEATGDFEANGPSQLGDVTIGFGTTFQGETSLTDMVIGRGNNLGIINSPLTLTAPDPATGLTDINILTVNEELRFDGDVRFNGPLFALGPISVAQVDSCPVGFAPNVDDRCDDFDECTVGNGGCAADRVCVNIYGGFRCIEP